MHDPDSIREEIQTRERVRQYVRELCDKGYTAVSRMPISSVEGLLIYLVDDENSIYGSLSFATMSDMSRTPSCVFVCDLFTYNAVMGIVTTARKPFDVYLRQGYPRSFTRNLKKFAAQIRTELAKSSSRSDGLVALIIEPEYLVPLLCRMWGLRTPKNAPRPEFGEEAAEVAETTEEAATPAPATAPEQPAVVPPELVAEPSAPKPIDQ